MMSKRPRTLKPLGSEKPNKFAHTHTAYVSLFYMYYMTYIFFAFFSDDDSVLVVHGYSLKRSSTERGVVTNQYFHTEKVLPPLLPIQPKQQLEDEKNNNYLNNPNIPFVMKHQQHSNEHYHNKIGRAHV